MTSARKPPLERIPPEIACAADYEAFARERVEEGAWAYLDGAAADALTHAENLKAFARIRLVNRVLADLAGGHTRLELFGCAFDHPVMVAPVAFQKLAHPDGELATVTAAGVLKAGMVVSAQASMDMEELARQAAGPLWFQLYIQPDRDFTLQLVRRAEKAGYRALVLTVDAPVHGARNSEQRAGFSLPPDVEAVNLKAMRPLPPYMAGPGESAVFASPLLAAAPGWKDLNWLAAHTNLPILLKGILHPADAARAVEAGASGIVVSNHGGRTLDTLPAAIEALPGIVEAVAGRVPVLMDGGVRRGTDIVKALALGAKAVLVGRPVIDGLAAAGAPGVAHVLHMLRAELEVAMVLTGCRTLADIDASILWQDR
ncbi:FMN-dependent alpha-hydroxy acid dehydrogenase [Parvibaculum lavamentivorans DS-1]|uniref:FMN-dependent alpha-hydroxy acid dehydrogenase n=1 Tax=Parvibaculum lavamentivorans (strain DS-1 / DSM 13023 / NCIMB 13966) TaxID=402881 RepID=A7HQ18_PARL1|nr:alpha-hydroxy acid oxidase [Parvibaculum lavamentivorans]ABS62001.1 FMN-dependent alpha-hydroxy acid dehydrogenase [Parvibaculum lavamentivorans DS-1]